jgi:DisA bacterial checkpoint controller nucleotide-binding
MIDIPELTRSVFEETRLLGESIKYDSLDLTADEQFSRSCEQFPLPTMAHATTVIEEAFWASLLTEEGRPCRPRLIYSPRNRDRGQATHWLEKPAPLNRDSLRKLTPTQGPLGYLVWDVESDKPEITGIEGRQGGDVCDFTIAAPNYGALDINWHCLRIIALRAGRLDRRSKEFLPDASRALDVVRGLLESFDPVYLGHTIRAIAKEGHGGAVWMLREAQAIDGIQIGHPIQRREPPTRERYEQRFKWLESVGNLATVDGAVLLDSHLRVLGFGCFIDVPDSPQEVFRLVGMNKVDRISSEVLGGGRHRSAIEFCCRFAPAAAVVVSEDGRISMMWATSGNPPFWAPLSILGFSGTLL